MNKNPRIISFDVDGTLVDQRFNDLIWENDIPALFAQEKNWDVEKAKDFCFSQYKAVGDEDLRWYDIEFWLKRFNISKPAKDILRDREDDIIVYPDVLPVLQELREKDFRIIVITCMPRIFLKEKIHTFDSHFEKVFSTISDFKKVKSPPIYYRISQLIKASPSDILHIGDHHQLDYQFSLQAGYKSLLIERGGKSKDFSISGLEEIFNFL